MAKNARGLKTLMKKKKSLRILQKLFMFFYLANTLQSSEYYNSEDVEHGVLLPRLACKKDDEQKSGRVEFFGQLNALSLTDKIKEKISHIYYSTSESELCFETDSDIKTQRLMSTTVSSLREGGFFIEDGSINVLAIALGQNTSLRLLNLANNGLGNQEIAIISQPLQQNKMLYLHTLDLSDNHIEDSGVIALAGCLEQNVMQFLHNLYLSDNEIGGAGLVTLLKSLEKNTVLHVLDLANNHIENSKMSIAARSLNQNVTLYALDLRYNTIDVLSLLEKKIIDVSILNRVIFFNSSILPFQSKPISNWPLKLIPLPLHEIIISEGRVKLNQNKRRILPRLSLLNHSGHHHACSIC